MFTICHTFLPPCCPFQVAFPSKAPKVELQNTSGLGDDELAAVVQQIEDWQDQHYPLGDEEEAPSCLTLVEGVLDALDSINQNQRCSICLLPLLDWEAGKEVMALATRTACGHIYCFGCLSTWWIQHEEASKKRASETIVRGLNCYTTLDYHYHHGNGPVCVWVFCPG